MTMLAMRRAQGAQRRAKSQHETPDSDSCSLCEWSGATGDCGGQEAGSAKISCGRDLCGKLPVTQRLAVAATPWTSSSTPSTSRRSKVQSLTKGELARSSGCLGVRKCVSLAIGASEVSSSRVRCENSSRTQSAPWTPTSSQRCGGGFAPMPLGVRAARSTSGSRSWSQHAHVLLRSVCLSLQAIFMEQVLLPLVVAGETQTWLSSKATCESVKSSCSSPLTFMLDLEDCQLQCLIQMHQCLKALQEALSLDPWETVITCAEYVRLLKEGGDDNTRTENPVCIVHLGNAMHQTGFWKDRLSRYLQVLRTKGAL